jgi:hypothetical protein
MMTPCPACGIGRLRRRHNATRVTDSGTLSLLRCTNPQCRHHVWRLADKEHLLPLEPEAQVRANRFGVNVSDLILTPPTGVN